jgi:ribosomal protein S12 methylthiotransferase accessory factor
MIDVPRFKSHLHVEELTDEGVFLLSEKGSTVLRGRLYEQIVPLIDGRRSTDDIVDLLDGQLAAAEIYHAVRQLEQKGYLADADGSSANGAEVFWHIQDVDPRVARQRLKEAEISVTALAGLAVEPLESVLRALHVGRIANPSHNGQPAEGGQLGIVLTDDYLRAGLEAYNRQALELGRPWLLIKPVGCQIWIGPVFVPHKTGCWECLARRLRRNREAESYIQAKTGRTDPFPVPRADTPAIRAVAWNLAATEIARWVARAGESELEGKVLTLNSLNWKTQTHVLTRQPQCPGCGCRTDFQSVRTDTVPDELKIRPTGAALEGRDPAIVLQSRVKVFTRDGGHRALSPDQTLRRFEHHVSPVTGAVTTLERWPVPGDGLVNVYGSGHNVARGQANLAGLRSGLRVNCAGKGTTELQAKASALCEALERYSGVFQGDEGRTAPERLRDLGPAAIHPNTCMLYSESQYRDREFWNARKSSFNWVPEPFDEDAPVEWTPVWSLTRREVRYLPTAYCYYDFPEPWPSCCACSNGNAAGNTLEEAILQGFFELVERDSVALWWYNRVRRPAVDLASFGEPYLSQLASFLHEQHRELWALDMTADLGIPVFAALSRQTDRQPEQILMGFGAHFDARIALLRAVTELNQMLSWILTDTAGKPVLPFSVDDKETVDWLRTATLSNQPYLAPAEQTPPRVHAEYPECRTDDIRDDVLACQALVEAKGMEMLVLDQTRPDIGLPVVKVIVPGLRHFWARYAPGRLYDVPVQLGWLDQPLAESELNPVHMFL